MYVLAIATDFRLHGKSISESAANEVEWGCSRTEIICSPLKMWEGKSTALICDVASGAVAFAPDATTSADCPTTQGLAPGSESGASHVQVGIFPETESGQADHSQSTEYRGTEYQVKSKHIHYVKWLYIHSINDLQASQIQRLDQMQKSTCLNETTNRQKDGTVLYRTAVLK